MITEHDLQEAIAECEGQRNPTANTCMKLAAFYTIKNELYPEPGKPEIPSYSMSPGPSRVEEVTMSSDTEFGRVISGMDTAVLIPIMDELMSTLSVVCPRLYAGVMRKLSDL